ncbi:MAG: TrkA family potassium uptake protein [Clostridia bacterium]|nr:TrkA family potassium uptake protein [Clostridia bacterium]
MRVLIVGGGKLGFNLARTLLEEGKEVRIIEIDRARCEELANELDIPIYCGDGTEVEALADAGISLCDTFIATTSRDECNLIACELAKSPFNVKKTVARVNNPKNISIMRKLGVDFTVSSTVLMAGVIEHEIDGAQVRFITDINNSDVVISEYTIPADWDKSGTTVMNLNLPENCLLVYVMREKEMMIPRGNTALYAGDEFIALTVGNASKKLRKIFDIQK